MSRIASFLPGFASAFVLVMALPSVSQAQTCASNADCMNGLTCQVSAVPPQPAADPSCVKGQTCTTTGGAVSSPVPVQNTTTCQVAPCKVDSDCGGGMVCHSEKSVSCSGGGATCPANTACDVAPLPIPPDSCTETTISLCAFKWQLPCNLDQDCGGDFVCVPAVSGSCSGGSGVVTGGGTGSVSTGTVTPDATDPAIGALAPIAPDVDGGTVTSPDGGTTCTTTTTFPGYCQPKSISCTVDGDCPTLWTCVAAPTPLTRAAAPGGVEGVSATPVAPTDPVTTKICQPPTQYPVRGTGTGIATDVGLGNADGGTLPPTSVGSKGSNESASGSGNAGCAVAGSGASTELPLLGSVLLGLLVSGLMTIRRRTARRNH